MKINKPGPNLRAQRAKVRNTVSWSDLKKIALTEPNLLLS